MHNDRERIKGISERKSIASLSFKRTNYRRLTRRSQEKTRPFSKQTAQLSWNIVVVVRVPNSDANISFHPQNCLISLRLKVKNRAKREDWKVWGRRSVCRVTRDLKRRPSVCRGTPDFSNPYWYNVILMLQTLVPARLLSINIGEYPRQGKYSPTSRKNCISRCWENNSTQRFRIKRRYT